MRIHALTARAARETTTDPAAVAHAAANALLALWPDNDHATTDLVAALRANTTTLAGTADGLLWHPDGHTLLYKAGNSLLNAGLHTPAVTYWHHMTEQAGRMLGDEHPRTLICRSNLANAYQRAGRTAEAITLGKQVVADAGRLLGPEHPHTVAAASALSAWRNEA